MPSPSFLPLREVRPSGWIETFLKTQAAGLTGHPSVHGYPFGQKFWGAPNDDTGPYAAWWPYEQTGYWLDGALKCGYLCGDQTVYNMALEEIETALANADPDGYIGPEIMRDKDRWPHAVFLRAVIAQIEISGDRRYLDALARHYKAMPHPMGWERDVTGVEILVYLYQQTNDAAFLEQAEDLYQRFNEKFPNHDCALETMASDKKITVHGVTFNELAKLAAILYSVTGKEEYRQAVVNAYQKVDRDQLLADGLHSSSEDLRGRDPLDSHETCDITDYTWALGYLLQVTRDARYADRIEKVIFNALPGAVTKDFKALQYLSCPNQVIATHTSNHNTFMRAFNWMSYRPDHEVQCCPGNVHRAMPNFVARQWLKGSEDEIIAVLYGPGRVRTRVGGVPATITARTSYPCEQGLEFDIDPERPAHFTFTLRIPGWCKRASVSLNGQPLGIPLSAGTFVPLERDWQPGDRLRLDIPFELALQHFPRGGISLDYGPLTFSLPIAARAEVEAGDSTNEQRRIIHAQLYTPRSQGATSEFPAWKLTPASAWNYALCVDEKSLHELVQIQWDVPPSATPFDPARPFVTLRVPARRVESWELAQRRDILQENNWVVRGKWRSGMRRVKGRFLFTPQLPGAKDLKARLGQEVEWIELIPYGATLLRMTVFPQAAPSKRSLTGSV
jgi:hypothetical protein